MTFAEWKRLRTALGKNTPISPDEIWGAATAAEREACAQVCDFKVKAAPSLERGAMAAECAEDIRKRSNA